MATKQHIARDQGSRHQYSPDRRRYRCWSCLRETLGNPEGPSALACEWLGTALARWLGLQTFETAIVNYPDELRVDLGQGCYSESGPAFAARAVEGIPWSGASSHLDEIENPEDLAGLVVLDTWLRNPDRFFPRIPPRKNLRNLFMSEESASKGRYRVLAIDHTACLRQDQELSMKHLRVDEERDPEVYGLFPEFIAHITRERVRRFLERLASLAAVVVTDIVQQIPIRWLKGEVRNELAGFCLRRAQHVTENLETWLEGPCAWQALLPFGNGSSP